MAKNVDVSKSTTPTIEVPHLTKTSKEASKEMLDKYIAEETKLVKGRFRHYETPGKTERIMFRKYPGIPMFDKWMKDGEVYEIPLYVARHLQGFDVTAKQIDGKVNSCRHVVHGYKTTKDEFPTRPLDGETPSISEPKQTKARMGFESLEFENLM